MTRHFHLKSLALSIALLAVGLPGVANAESNFQTGAGTLNATGTVGWAPGLNWDIAATLAGFDPGYFAAGWDGNISGRFSSVGNALPAPQTGFNASLNVPQLRGTLRGRPLDARGDFTLRGQQGQGDLALSLGGEDAAKRVYMLVKLEEARRTGVKRRDLPAWLQQAAVEYVGE